MSSNLSLRLLAGTALAGCLALAACGEQKADDSSGGGTEMAATEASPELGTFGIELGDMDTSVEPGDDFNAYVNGKWNLLDECKSSQELAKLFPPGKLRIKICTGAARFLL